MSLQHMYSVNHSDSSPQRTCFPRLYFYQLCWHVAPEWKVQIHCVKDLLCPGKDKVFYAMRRHIQPYFLVTAMIYI